MMKLPILFVCTLLLLGFSNCKEKDPAPLVNQVSGSEATIPWQECVTFTDHQLTVCFVDAKENRCPCNADCIWEGTVDATLHVTSSTGIDTTITLTTNSSPIGLHDSETIGAKTIRFLRMEVANPGDCVADYGNYEKYEAVISVQ